MLAAMATVCAEKLPPGLRKYRIGAPGTTAWIALGRCSTSARAGGTPLPPSMNTRAAKPTAHSRRAIDRRAIDELPDVVRTETWHRPVTLPLAYPFRESPYRAVACRGDAASCRL